MKRKNTIKENINIFREKIKVLSGWNRARIFVLIGLIVVIIEKRSVNLKKLATFINPENSLKANYRRITRFFQFFKFDRTIFAKILSSFLPEGKWILIMDRTNWKFGRIDINFLVLSVAYKGMAIPILWYILKNNKKGNSNYKDRIRIMRKFIEIFGKEKIKVLLADREFIGKEWFYYLKKRKIPFVIRVRNNIKIGDKPIKQLFRELNIGYVKKYFKKVNLFGYEDLNIEALRNQKGELIVVVTNIDSIEAIKLYKKRWEIETLFSALKKRGFNLEETHLKDYNKLTLLFGIISLAFVWCYHIGIIRAKVKYIKILKHGFKEKSYFMYGLEFLCQLFSNFYYNVEKIKIVFEFFISKLTKNPYDSNLLERIF